MLIISHIHCGDVLLHNVHCCSHWCDFVSSGMLLHLLDATSTQLYWIAALSCAMRSVLHFIRSNTFQVFQAEEWTMSVTRYASLLKVLFFRARKVKSMTLPHIRFSYIATQSCLIDCWNASEFSISPSFSITEFNFFHQRSPTTACDLKRTHFLIRSKVCCKLVSLLLLLCNSTEDWNGSHHRCIAIRKIDVL